MKFSKFIIAAGTAALILTSASPALAATARLRTIPNKVYQGGSFVLESECPHTDSSLITSTLLPHPIWLHASHHRHYVLVNVGRTISPGVYEFTLRCFRSTHRRTMMAAARTAMAAAPMMDGYWMTCEAHAWETVLRHTSPTPPHKAGHHWLRMHGKRADVIINTGFGSMAPSVSQHYPAS
jgi:hypothetical protein